MKKLPIGIQDLKKIIIDNYLYIDKTKQIYDLINTGQAYFLSRPRRFGKSLLCSTLKEIFSGNKKLFKDCWIYNSDFKWEKHPVIHLSMTQIAHETPEQLNQSLIKRLTKIAEQFNSNKIDALTPGEYLLYLIEQLGKKNKVVLIVDEYDKPILDHITNTQVATKMRDILRNFYVTIKDLDPYLKFVFLTGVSKFSRTSVFSGLNNLKDISLRKEFSTICGYTSKEVSIYFENRIKQIEIEKKETKELALHQIKKWYNGYLFCNQIKDDYKVYNPFSVLSYFDSKEFLNYWFETGTPTFLMKLIKEKKYPVKEIENIIMSEDDMTSFEIENLNLITILFQTGYLTIKGFEPELRHYTLGYPNQEVKISMLKQIFKSMTSIGSAQFEISAVKIRKNLEENNLNNFIQDLKNLFIKLPYDLHETSERFYQAMFFIIVQMTGFEVQAEEHTQFGRSDIVLKTNSHVYIFEFKINIDAQKALEQIEDKKYYEKYLDFGKKITLIGIAFDTEQRNISDWKVKQVMEKNGINNKS